MPPCSYKPWADPPKPWRPEFPHRTEVRKATRKSKSCHSLHARRPPLGLSCACSASSFPNGPPSRSPVLGRLTSRCSPRRPRISSTPPISTPFAFPPPPWAAEQFARAATDGSLAYTGYRGNAQVLTTLAGSVGSFLDLPLDPRHHLILTPGPQAGLFATLASLVEDGDRVALIDPDYLLSARVLRFLASFGF